MAYSVTTATRKITSLRKNIRLVAGGTSASKTVSILMTLIDTAQVRKNILIEVVSETMPHMRGGAMLDFENIMRSQGYWNEARWNKTLCVYTFETGTKMHFFSADAPSKVHGLRRDILYINEGNFIPWQIADHMIVRTRETVWVDWNPSEEFWAYTELMPNNDHDFITLTYKDNEALDAITVARIESHKHNAMWWRVYGEGLLGEIEGRIFTGWKWLDDVPHEARLVKRGLDFGYTNDPTALLDVYEYNGGFIFDEQLYQYGLSNKAIAEFVNTMPNRQTLIVADSSEPKSIDELRSYGLNMLGANKGQGSVLQGVQYVQNARIFATKRSVRLKKEYQRYMWQKDKISSEFINKPQDVDNHLMDAARYALESYMPRAEETVPVSTGEIETLFY